MALGTVVATIDTFQGQRWHSQVDIIFDGPSGVSRGDEVFIVSRTALEKAEREGGSLILAIRNGA